MNLKDIKETYKSGKINKWEYIDKMYAVHATLFAYSKYIEDTNISAIEIKDEKVIMTFRDSGVRLLCVENDKRLAPMDTLNFGSYELAELALQQSMIKDGMIVFDIGANFGWYAVHIAKARPGCTVHSFEPFPATFRYLNENIGLNAIKNIVTHNFGFSDEKGQHRFFIDPALSVNASLVNVSGSTEVTEAICDFETLDNYCYDTSLFPDLIKCDVEGAEWLVCKGGLRLLNDKQPIVFAEMLRKWAAKFNYHPNDIIGLFRETGYMCFAIEDGSIYRIEEVTEETRATNYIFLHPVRHADEISRVQNKN